MLHICPLDADNHPQLHLQARHEPKDSSAAPHALQVVFASTAAEAGAASEGAERQAAAAKYIQDLNWAPGRAATKRTWALDCSASRLLRCKARLIGSTTLH